ncbi:histidine phosphatase family protein [Salipaludibacillus neizhouensis]|uniref:histidine phosphatase family protein n=1 Tax=Salipaludibacillus neizhouensis TaxID=885475 RepID=UPI001601B0F4|nr:histidine phosphatase family protein [Salipaludibacillus neizhouensis]
MEISFIRHGKSQLSENDKITCFEFRKWVEKYDCHGVFKESIFPYETLVKAKTANIIITSELNRSVESAMLLNSKVKTISDSLFRETELPARSMKIFNIKLKPNSWALILRLLWLCGYSNECESLKSAKLRAENGSQQLIDYAKKYGSVVLVGHGFLNTLIAIELRKKGWEGNRKAGAKLNCNPNNGHLKKVPHYSGFYVFIR